LDRILTSPRWQAAFIGLGVLLCAPSLTTGFVADDWFQKLRLEGRPIDGMSKDPLDLFTFADGVPEHMHRLVDAGFFPWWADPEAKLTLLRPITAWTHALDHLLWPESPAAAHLQSLVWFALALMAAAWVYRSLLPARAAGLAILLMAVDDAHGQTVGWISNRNAVVAFALALPAIALHHRWRSAGWRPGAILAPLCLLAGLLSGEAAIAVVGYLVAYALHVDRGTWASRAVSLVPTAAVVLAWHIPYAAHGFGAAHSGIYFDPAHDLKPFWSALPLRAAALLASEFAFPRSDYSVMYQYMSPLLGVVMAVVAVLTVIATTFVFLPFLREDRTSRMLGTGLLLATIPLCTTFPSDRLLFFVSLGAMGLVAQYLCASGGRLHKLVAGTYVAIHLIASPPVLALRSRFGAEMDASMQRTLDSIPSDPTKTVIIANAPTDLLTGYLQATREARHEPHPEHIRWLSTTTAPVELVREDSQTVLVRPEGGFVSQLGTQLVRNPERPMPVGTVVQLTGMTVTVTATTPQGRPTEARVRFDRPLEDPSYVWLQWGVKSYVPFQPPAVGGQVTLQPVDMIAALTP
jgi:hypothetical protein